MAKITTVTGDIKPEEMGYCTMHDHTFLDLSTAAEYMKSIFWDVKEEQIAFIPENYPYLKTGMFLLNDELKLIDDFEGLKKEYEHFKALGGRTVVDPLPATGRCKNYAALVSRLSKETGLYFITATGFYHDTAIPAEVKGKDADFYYQVMKREIEHGIDGTGVKPGCLKGALNTCSDTERNILEACIKLSKETGLSVHVHTEPTVEGEDIVTICDSLTEKYGLNPERVHICHMDNRIVASTMVTDFLEDMEAERTLDLELHKTLCQKGYTIGLDTWGMPIANMNMFMPDDFDRLKALIALCDMGYEDQITLGCDFSNKIEWRKYGGYGVTRFEEFAGQLMELLGREEQFHKLVYENPMRIMMY